MARAWYEASPEASQRQRKTPLREGAGVCWLVCHLHTLSHYSRLCQSQSPLPWSPREFGQEVRRSQRSRLLISWREPPAPHPPLWPPSPRHQVQVLRARAEAETFKITTEPIWKAYASRACTGLFIRKPNLRIRATRVAFFSDIIGAERFPPATWAAPSSAARVAYYIHKLQPSHDRARFLRRPFSVVFLLVSHSIASRHRAESHLHGDTFAGPENRLAHGAAMPC